MIWEAVKRKIDQIFQIWWKKTSDLEEEEEPSCEMYQRSDFNNGPPITYSQNCNLFTLKVHHGGVLIQQPEINYVGGIVDYFDECDAMNMKLSALKEVTSKLGYPDFLKLMYKIPLVDGKIRFREIVVENDVIDMASIGKGNGEVEVFVLHEFDIGFINDQLGCSSAVVERRNVTVEELDKVKETTIVEKQKRICKKRKENTSKADEVGKSDDADSSSDANSEPIDCEYFHDSDYDFSKDDDELIYQKSINDAAQDVSTPLGKSRADHPSSSRAKTSSGEGGREKDFHVYDGEQIGINEDSDSWNSEELYSMCSSSDEDTGVSNKAKFVRFRSEIDMDDPKFYVGLQFGTKNEFKEAVDYHGVKWGTQFTWKKNDSRRMRAVCNSEHCGWFIYASKMADSDSCIALTGELPETFVHPCYSKSSYLKAYQPAINPINGPNGWRKSDMPPVFAPKKMKLPGRPKKARRREPDEQRTNDKGVAKLSKIGITKMSCSKCHQRGHTVRKCPLTAEESSDAAHSRGPATNKCSRCKEYGHNVRRCPAAEEGGQDMPHNEPGFNMNEHGEYVDVNIQVAETTIVEPAIIVQVTQAEVIDPTPTSHSQKNVPNAGSRGERKRTKKRANRMLIDERDDANEE